KVALKKRSRPWKLPASRCRARLLASARRWQKCSRAEATNTASFPRKRESLLHNRDPRFRGDDTVGWLGGAVMCRRHAMRPMSVALQSRFGVKPAGGNEKL